MRARFCRLPPQASVRWFVTGKAGFARSRRDARVALDQIENFVFRQRARLGVVSEQLQLHCRRRQRFTRDVARRLPTGVIDLHPQLIAGDCASPRPGPQAPHRRGVGRRRIDRDVGRPFEHAAIDHHVAGDQQARAAF
jgi:sarcosine oxidase delta subunit